METTGGKLEATASGDVGNTVLRENRLCVYDRKNALRWLVDTGANISVIPKSKVNKHLRRGNVSYKLYAANGSEIQTYGTVTLELNLRLRRALKWVFVIANVSKPILGADFLEHYKLLVDVSGKCLRDKITDLKTIGILVDDGATTVSTFDGGNPCSEILARYPDITRPFNLKYDTKHGVHHYIDTKGPPVHAKARRLPPDRYDKVREEFRNMQELGICRPSKSEWASPLHVVPKKDGQIRPCGDYRQLNAATKPDRYPIPRLQDFTYGLSGKKLFSHIDANKAFHNIPINPQDVEKTAIITPFGLFEFPRMTFGLCNAAQTYQRFMNDVVLKGIEQIRCEATRESSTEKSNLFCYIDDVIISSHCVECHKKHLDVVCQRYSECGLTINMAKCEFAKDKVEFLGYEVSAEGITPLQSKVEAIMNFPRPQTVEQLRRFLGMINFYRSHLPRAVEQQQELNKFLHNTKKRDKTRITWTEEASKAFEQCKVSLRNAITLAHPLEGVPLALMSDASDSCIGGVLQQWDGKSWRPLGFYSKKLSGTQTKYSTYDRELLAIYLSIEHFQNMIEGRPLIIFTDHKPLSFAFTKPDNGKELARRIRQLAYISEFSTDIRHIKGDLNIVADALSRVETIECPTVFDFADLARAQEADTQITLLLNEASDKNSYELKQCSMPNSDSKIYCEVTQKNIRPYVPENMRKQVFDAIHGISHPGIRTTRRMVAKRYFWPGMNKDVGLWAKTCIACQRAKVVRHTSSGIGQFEKRERFEHIHVDIVGPLQTTQEGYRYVLTVIDRFTRWPEAFPLKTITADIVAKTLYEGWICRFGNCRVITTDKGRQFESDLFTKLMHMLGVSRIRTTPYHPESNGMIERWHRSLKAALMARLSQTSWVDELPTILLGLRTAIRSDSGISAAELVYGQTITLPGEMYVQSPQRSLDEHEYLETLRKSIAQNRPQPSSHSNSRTVFVHPDLKLCEYVFIRNDAVRKPLQPPYDGPYKIVSRTDKYYSIQLPNRITQVSIDRLKPAYLIREDEDTLGRNPRVALRVRGQTNQQTIDMPPPFSNFEPAADLVPASEKCTRSGRVVKRPVRFIN